MPDRFSFYSSSKYIYTTMCLLANLPHSNSKPSYRTDSKNQFIRPFKCTHVFLGGKERGLTTDNKSLIACLPLLLHINDDAACGIGIEQHPIGWHTPATPYLSTTVVCAPPKIQNLIYCNC